VAHGWGSKLALRLANAGHTGSSGSADIVGYLETRTPKGVRHVLSVPIGFVCDHLQVLYDIDREAAAGHRR
jgi:ferrochelatase